MNDLETIDDYFAGRLGATEKTRFEQQIVADPELAEAVAFYINAKQLARAEALKNRKAEWEAAGQTAAQVRPRWVPMAYVAAACALLAIGLFLFYPRPSAEQLADQYIQSNLTTLTLTMSSRPDSLQLARQAYNEGRFDEANAIITARQRRDSTNADLLKLAGLVSLRQGNYDQAIAHFHRLSQRTDLRANPGLFYEALTYLKRNQPNDKNAARQLLQTVVNQQLDGEKAAEKLLKNIN